MECFAHFYTHDYTARSCIMYISSYVTFLFFLHKVIFAFRQTSKNANILITVVLFFLLNLTWHSWIDSASMHTHHAVHVVTYPAFGWLSSQDHGRYAGPVSQNHINQGVFTLVTASVRRRHCTRCVGSQTLSFPSCKSHILHWPVLAGRAIAVSTDPSCVEVSLKVKGTTTKAEDKDLSDLAMMYRDGSSLSAVYPSRLSTLELDF
jgi:hypothetical protein